MKPISKVIHLGWLAAAALGLSCVAVAQNTVMLAGAHEVPAVSTAATAQSTIAVSSDMSVSGTITTTGIEGTMAHIHLGAPGTNGPVIVKLVQSQPGVWSVPDGTKLTADQYTSYKAGNLYVNVHSAAHPNGEIRAQLKP